MSETVFKNFIYVERKTKRVLAVRRTRDLDVSFSTEELFSYQVISPESLFLDQPQSFTYAPATGFQAFEGKDSAADLQSLALLQKKVEILYLLLINVLLVKNEFTAKLEPELVQKLSLNPANYGVIHALVLEEKRLLSKKCDDFFADFLSRVAQIGDLETLKKEYRSLTYNFNIGVYSASRKTA